MKRSALCHGRHDALAQIDRTRVKRHRCSFTGQRYSATVPVATPPGTALARPKSRANPPIRTRKRGMSALRDGSPRSARPPAAGLVTIVGQVAEADPRRFDPFRLGAVQNQGLRNDRPWEDPRRSGGRRTGRRGPAEIDRLRSEPIEEFQHAGMNLLPALAVQAGGRGASPDSSVRSIAPRRADPCGTRWGRVRSGEHTPGLPACRGRRSYAGGRGAEGAVTGSRSERERLRRRRECPADVPPLILPARRQALRCRAHAGHRALRRPALGARFAPPDPGRFPGGPNLWDHAGAEIAG